MWRIRPTVLLAAAWAAVAIRIVRRRTHRVGVAAVAPRCPRLPASSGIGVQAVLSRWSPTCLERALVLQSWNAGHGHHHDVVVGIPIAGIGKDPAHAWLDGVDVIDDLEYREIHRMAASGGRSGREDKSGEQH